MGIAKRGQPLAMGSGARARARRLGLAAATVALTVAALGPAAAPAAAADPVVLRVGQDRPVSGGYAGFSLGIMAMYEPLVAVQVDTPDRKFPLFAESYSANADSTVWTFKIRPGLKWSDGQPATAQDVLFTIKYLKDSVTAGKAIYAWASLDQIKDVQAPDDQTVVMTLAGPADVTLILNNQGILPEHVWKSVSFDDAAAKSNEVPQVITGPFMATELKDGQFVKLDKNPYFRGPGPFIDEVIISQFANQDAEAQALKTGEIDLALAVPLASFDDLSHTAGIHTIASTLGAFQALDFNTRTGKGAGSTSALLDQKFRDAVGYAIDKQTLVQKVLGGHGAPMQSLFTQFSGDFQQPLTGIERTFDIAKANQLLDEAGYAKGSDGIRLDKDGKPLQLSMLVQAGSQMATAAQFIIAWLGQVGIGVTASSVEEAAFFTKAFSAGKDGGGGFDLAIEQTYLNPWASELQWWTTGKLGSMNVSYWTDPQFDSLVGQILTTIDKTQLHQLADQAARLIYTQAPIIPLYENYWLQAYRTDTFEGWTGCPNDAGLVSYCMPPDLTYYNIRPIGTGPSAAPSDAAPASPGASASTPASTAPSAAPSASAAPEPGSTSGGGVPTGAVAVVAIVVVGVAAWLLVRRRRTA